MTKEELHQKIASAFLQFVATQSWADTLGGGLPAGYVDVLIEIKGVTQDFPSMRAIPAGSCVQIKPGDLAIGVRIHVDGKDASGVPVDGGGPSAEPYSYLETVST